MFAETDEFSKHGIKTEKFEDSRQAEVGNAGYIIQNVAYMIMPKQAISRINRSWLCARPTKINLVETMNKVLTALYALALLLICYPASASSEIELLMFDEQYCSWCKQWEEEIGVIYNVTPAHCQAPLKKIDIGDSLPDSIVLDEPVIYTPTFVLIVEGKEVGRIVGYPGQDFFWPMLDDIISEGIPQNVQAANSSQCKNT